MKRWSASLVIRKLQINTTFKYHYIHIEGLKLKRLSKPSVDKKVEEAELSLYAVDGNIKWYDHFVKQFDIFLKS